LGKAGRVAAAVTALLRVRFTLIPPYGGTRSPCRSLARAWSPRRLGQGGSRRHRGRVAEIPIPEKTSYRYHAVRTPILWLVASASNRRCSGWRPAPFPCCSVVAPLRFYPPASRSPSWTFRLRRSEWFSVTASRFDSIVKAALRGGWVDVGGDLACALLGEDLNGYGDS
jgi:hypothetical protein